MPGNQQSAIRRLIFRGIPEREQFATQEQFDQAIEKISREGGSPRNRKWWIGVVMVIAVAWGARTAAKQSLRAINWPPAIEELVVFGAIALSAVLTIRALLRWGSPTSLRKELVRLNIPVCLTCGYSLQGHPPDADKCPECGTAVSGEVRSILANRARAK